MLTCNPVSPLSPFGPAGPGTPGCPLQSDITQIIIAHHRSGIRTMSIFCNINLFDAYFKTRVSRETNYKNIMICVAI